MHPKNLSINDFFYELPDYKIARFPLKNRDESKLLFYKNKQISDHQFLELPEIISNNSLLVFNNTKVIHARLLFQKKTGATIEIFCLEPADKSAREAFNSTLNCTWKCLVGNAKRWKREILQKEIIYKEKKIQLNAIFMDQTDDYVIIQFSWNNDSINFGELLQQSGLLPLPPYLNRTANKDDESSYQTVFAKEQGSVAAPTAGLHFTTRLTKQLQQKNISSAELTLHVGAGTFKPVKSLLMEGHQMHRESIYVNLNTLEKIFDALVNNQPIIPVGTTSLRTLESVYWHGVKLLSGVQSAPQMDLHQWEAYQLPDHFLPVDAFKAIMENLKKNRMDELTGFTSILIAPGYKFKIADVLITNFHQPNSTLLLLVAAFVGADWEKIYTHALTNSYRFLSFGDSSILFKNQ
ncbi:MAG: S-adenosylmethionine:tRNA ribosyltransferase-isomerase [Bacteroidia bacterium]|nr:S-adenosylmethionine:tRNA ribosyltransferase-isomerase [Bacteroidia bacterium]